MACIFRRRKPHSARARGRLLLIGLAWLLSTGFSAPIEELRDEIHALKVEQASIAQREEGLLARQDDLSRLIKRLKSDARGQSGPFAPRRLETALNQLRAVLDERESLQRRRAELSVRIDEAETRLRAAVRDEILRIASLQIDGGEPRDSSDIRSLLTLYPPPPVLPTPPPGSELMEDDAFPDDPWTLTEQSLLLRDERERNSVVLQRAEYVHGLLSEELSLYQALAERERGFESHRQALDRRVLEAAVLIDALRLRMLRLDEALRQLDTRVLEPITDP